MGVETDIWIIDIQQQVFWIVVGKSKGCDDYLIRSPPIKLDLSNLSRALRDIEAQDLETMSFTYPHNNGLGKILVIVAPCLAHLADELKTYIIEYHAWRRKHSETPPHT